MLKKNNNLQKTIFEEKRKAMNILRGERSGGLGGVTQRHLWSLSNLDLPQRSAHRPQTVAAVYQVNYW